MDGWSSTRLRQNSGKPVVRISIGESRIPWEDDGMKRREFDGSGRIMSDPELQMERAAGRPSKYRQETVALARQLAMLGCTDDRMAQIIGVSRPQLNRWKTRYPDFREAIRQGREVADTAVARSLYQRAVGYSHPDTHISTSRSKDGTEVIQTPIVKYYPPDVTACIFWLANRQRDYWRHVAHIEHAGPDGGPIAFHTRVDLGGLSDAELSVARRIGLALRTGRTVTDA